MKPAVIGQKAKTKRIVVSGTKQDLCEFLRAEFEDHPTATRHQLLRTLVKCRGAVRDALTRKQPVRASRVASSLKAFADSLDDACSSLDEGGDRASVLLAVSAGLELNGPETLARPIAFLRKFRDVAVEAAQLAQDESRSLLQARRGRARDENLEALVLKLMTLYKEIYTARFQLTIDLNDSLISNSVGRFIKLILAVYKPADIEIGAHNVDRIVRACMFIQDLELFEPPPFTKPRRRLKR